MADSETLYLRYDPVAVTLHWIIALSILTMIPLGFFMGDFPIGIRFGAYTFHKSLGITVLALSLFRLVWRFLNPPPPLPAHMARWEKLGAYGAHWGLYFLMIAMPLTGWLMVSANPKYPTVYFWLTEVPFIPMPEGINPKATAHQFSEYHEQLAWIAIALVTLHIGAALKHHFMNRDGVLLRMVPLRLQRGRNA